jgi:uncharacterized protein DUF5648
MGVRVHKSLGWRTAAFASALFASALGTARAAVVDAIEYYEPALDHYFVTASPIEIGALDAGQFPGWQRTGLSFQVYDSSTTLFGIVPVCRFYGLPAAGLDSHFYSASVSECAEVKQKFPGAWMLESDNVFEVWLPDAAAGQCPSGSIPVYRAWNNRADSNHRYTTDPTVQQAMIAKGYTAEGYGAAAMPVAMCSPAGSSGSGAPVCAPFASDPAPYVGTTIAVFAHCTGNPTSFAWTGCTGSGGQCSVTASASGMQTYTVIAANGSGSSAPASVSVSWRGLPPPPVCSLLSTANSDRPTVNTPLLLTAVCTGNPTGFSWSGCASTGGSCYTTSASPGVQVYSVSASNAGGTSPPAPAAVDWQSTPSTPPGFCSQFPSFLYTDEGWTNATIASRDFVDDPGFAWNGVWVVKLSVPPGASAPHAGRLGVVEYGGPQTPREVTLSRVPCDFRPFDPSGVNGPLTVGDSVAPLNYIVVDSSAGGGTNLTPGVDYYYNVRNWQLDAGQISCDPAIKRCDALVTVVLPH